MNIAAFSLLVILFVCSIELGAAPTVKTAASLFQVRRSCSFVRMLTWFVLQELCYSNKDRLMAGIIVGGWDKKARAHSLSLPAP